MMKFFTSPMNMHNFYQTFKPSVNGGINIDRIAGVFSLKYLQLIAADMMFATGRNDLRSNDAFELITMIANVLKSWSSLDEDPLERAFRIQQTPSAERRRASRQPVRRQTPPRRQAPSRQAPPPRRQAPPPRRQTNLHTLTVPKLRALLTSHDLDASGNKGILVERLHRRESNALEYEDMSTKWLAGQLEREQVIVPQKRADILKLVRKGNDNPEDLDIGDFNDDVVNEYCNKYGCRGSRAEKLTKLRIQTIKELKDLVRTLDRKLYSCQQRAPGNRHAARGRHGTSGGGWGQVVAGGVVQGMTAAIVSNLLSGR